jgi:CubicO group peptidase (beta-lactamase class C family)
MTDQHMKTLAERASQLMAELHIPGAALGVVHNGELQTVGLGTTSVEHGLPVTGDTLFQIGSISKTFLGTAAMRLVEQGRLSLDAPVKGLLPELRLSDPTVEAMVTLRHLLSHTSGWTGDYFDDTGWGDDALARYVERMAALPQEIALGALFSYNNAGFNLAGRLIERASGLPFEQAMSELLIGPLGLEQCFYFPDDAMTRSFAVGHMVDGGRPLVARPWSIGRSSHAAGGVSASIGDLLRYAAFHIAGGVSASGERLLSGEGIAAMRAAQAPTGSLPDRIGLTWFMREAGGQLIIGHGGATNGQMAQLTIVPEAGFALASLTNASSGTTLNSELVRLGLKLFLGIEEPDPAPLSLPAEELAAYAGRYLNPLYEYELRAEGAGLLLAMTSLGGFPRRDSPPRPVGPPMPVALYAPDKLVVTEGPAKGARGDFGRDAAGNVAWLRFGSRVRMKA